MNDKQTAKILAATLRSRKATAIVIDQMFVRLRHEMFEMVLLEFDALDVTSAARGEYINLDNGSRVLFMTPQDVPRRLPGLMVDFAWVNGPIDRMARAYLTSRTMMGAGVLIETQL